ncbi:hypothetical protein CCH79_00020666, partial [Gambusia affinis]
MLVVGPVIGVVLLILLLLLCRFRQTKVRRSGDKNLRSTAPKPVLTASPSWPSPGTSVTLNCEIKPSSAGWRFYWYKVVPDLSKKNYRYKLLPDAINGPANNSFIIRGQKHTAGFACRAESGIPENFTDYSEPKFVWSADSHPAASLTVSPEREQLFTIDEIKVNCKGRSADWRVKRLTDQYYQSDLSDCSNWGTMTGSSCTFISPQYHRAVYWCEPGSGEFSNAVNITVNNFHPAVSLSVSPDREQHFTTESLTLNCGGNSTEWKLKEFRGLSLSSFPGVCSRPSRPRFSCTFSKQQSDKSVYWCESGSGEFSNAVNITFASAKPALTAGSSSFPVMLVVGPVIGVVLLILLLLLCRFRQT